jgi:hypothetical protein
MTPLALWTIGAVRYSDDVAMRAANRRRSHLLRTGTKVLVWTTVALLSFLALGNVGRLLNGSAGRDVIPMAGLVTTIPVLVVLMRAVSKIADELSDSEYAAATVQLRTVSSGIVLLIITAVLAGTTGAEGSDVRELLGDLISIVLFGSAILLLGSGVAEYHRARDLVER